MLFSVVVVLLVPFRTFVVPLFFSDWELECLDAPDTNPDAEVGAAPNYDPSLRVAAGATRECFACFSTPPPSRFYNANKILV